MLKSNHIASAQQFSQETTSGLSAGLREALEPLLREIEPLNEGIQEYDPRIAKMAKQTYPETALAGMLSCSHYGSKRVDPDIERVRHR